MDNRQIPLVVDLDGTLIRTDVMWESLARALKKNPFAIFQILFWWIRGRAFLKKKLAARVQINPATLPYNEKFLDWLRAEKKSGRKIILATASDLQMAKPIADYVGFFDEILASDGKTNLRGENKLRALTEKFGERGFDYAGNSSADFPVWRGAREAIVVNASRRVLREAANCTKLGPTFCENFSPFEIAKSFFYELFWRSGYLVSIFAGLLLAASFPKFNVAGFAWIAPALMLAAVRGKNSGDAARAGYVAGFAFWLASLYWLLLIPVAGLPILGWLTLSAFIALYFSAWVWLVTKFKNRISNFENSWSRRVLWSLGGAATWVALEMLRVRLFGGFPWNLLGATQYKLLPLIQIASVTGVYGVSFLIIWFSLALFCAGEMILRNPAKRNAWLAEIFLPLAIILILFVSGIFQLRREIPAEKNLRVTLIQPDFAQTLIWSPEDNEKRFQKLLNFSARALTNQTDLLVWPESAVPMLDGVYSAIGEFARAHHVAIIFNGDDAEFLPRATNFFNAAFFINANGELAGVYHKRNLVIFGEYIPLVRWLPFLKWFTPIEDGFAAGEKPVAFPLEKFSAKTSPLICYEDSFPRLANEAATDDLDFLINLTNDGWFGDSAEQWQHFADAIFRAVENGVPLVRCCNNGITGWIDAHGRVREIFRDGRGSEYGAGALTIEIPLLNKNEKSAPTFYNRHGDWFGWSCVGATIFVIAFAHRRKNIS
jgi:apolipoprotein N-acyltransferase